MNRTGILSWFLVSVVLTSAADAQQSPPKPSVWDDGSFLIAAGVLAIAALAGFGILISKIVEVVNGTGRDTETRQLHFAAVILSGLALLFILSMGMYYWAPSDRAGVAKEIFDASKTIIPPIVTLVLGYYFGKRTADS